jgi:hypothetical protein
MEYSPVKGEEIMEYSPFKGEETIKGNYMKKFREGNP